MRFFKNVCHQNVRVFLINFFITNYDDYNKSRQNKVCFWFLLLQNLTSPLDSAWSCFQRTGNNHIQEFDSLIQRSKFSDNI